MIFTVSFAEIHQTPAISELAENSFRATYDWYNPAERMDAYVTKNLQPHHFVAILEDARAILLVAEVEGKVGGYVQLGPGDTPAAVSPLPALELKRLYVDASWHGCGIAAALIAACVAESQRRDYASIWLGVWHKNPRAIAFYKKQGFLQEGELVFQFEDDPQKDLLFARGIQASEQ